MRTARSTGRDASRIVLLALCSAIVVSLAWLVFPGSSDAQGDNRDRSATPSLAVGGNQSAFAFGTAVTPAGQSLAKLAQEAAPAEPIAREATATPPSIVPVETVAAARAPVDGLKIASQSWRRGGLGSKALVTLTVRNANDYAVKDVEIACAFSRQDGSLLTNRKRVIGDTITTKSRKTYSGVLIGFVNVNANKAKCSLITASRA